MLTVATLEPSHVSTSDAFAGIRVETSDVPVTKKGDASNVWTPYRLFQTFTPDDTRRFRDIAVAHGVTVLPLD